MGDEWWVMYPTNGAKRQRIADGLKHAKNVKLAPNLMLRTRPEKTLIQGHLRRDRVAFSVFFVQNTLH